MARFKNVQWRIGGNDLKESEPLVSNDYVQQALLMDIRDELQALNRVMQCSNVARGFRALSSIARQNETAFKRRVENAVRKRLKRRSA